MSVTATVPKTKMTIIPEIPVVQLSNYVGEPNPNSPNVLFSIRIPAKHQASDLSIIQMQDNSLALNHLLCNVKNEHRDKTKFTVPTEIGPCVIKLHYLMFPNVEDEIQIDYTYSIPNNLGKNRSVFSHGKRLADEVGQCIHTNLRHEISAFAATVHELVCDFVDKIYYDSIAAGKLPDYLMKVAAIEATEATDDGLITTPPPVR